MSTGLRWRTLLHGSRVLPAGLRKSLKTMQQKCCSLGSNSIAVLRRRTTLPGSTTVVQDPTISRPCCLEDINTMQGAVPQHSASRQYHKKATHWGLTSQHTGAQHYLAVHDRTTSRSCREDSPDITTMQEGSTTAHYHKASTPL